MYEMFRPYERLVEISVLGKHFLVPEKNSLLRCFQFISPGSVLYGRFCSDQQCQHCRVMCQLPDDHVARPVLSCKFIASAGLVISEISPELESCLRGKLGREETPARDRSIAIPECAPQES
jgi:hypothetical protein